MDETDFPEDLAVRVRNVGKTYRLGVISRRTLRDELVYRWLRLRGRDPKDSMGCIGGGELADPGLFHALDDISFDIRKGETVGLVGRNGAGKSTMLKILARITTPTTGEAWIRGRVGSMLEVGTGFHPELTGRENIYLNGTILGMTKQEIDAKFDEIVEFSEIGEFLDTPVKRYSSGMYVKLAFSIASSLDNDVLLLDEVLAVGDAAFRRKSLARMKEIAASGRTILFVSHSLGDVKTICSRCLLFDRGVLCMDGKTIPVLKEYERISLSNHLEPHNPPTSKVLGISKLRDEASSVTSPDRRFFVDVDGLEMVFDDARGGWNLKLSYSTSNSLEWSEPRAAVAVRFLGSKGSPMTVFDSSVVPGLPKACPPKGMLVAEISPHVSFSLPEVIFDVRLWSSTVLVFDQALVSSAVIPPDRFSPVGWLRTPFRQSEMRFFHLWRLDNPSPSPALSNRSDRLGNGFVRGTDLRVLFDHARKNWSIRIDYRTNSGNKWTCPRAALAVRTAEPYSRVVCVFDSASENQLQGPLPGKGFLRIVLPEGFAFHRGEYSVDFRLWERKEPADDVVSALTFQVDAESESPGWLEHHPYKEGIVNVIHHWLSGTENPEGDEK